MADAQPIGSTSRRWLVGLCLGAMFALIAIVTWKGDPSNSLHTSAQSWGFTVFGGILAGLGFGAVAEFVPFLKR
ncbi:MAG: hypothetical protein K2Y29_00505 [Beijerinckiaceae bacterium]|nr:hypothetical protein [Beijerinckiaceae bacterium]